jgi:hypothetical protein
MVVGFKKLNDDGNASGVAVSELIEIDRIIIPR